MGLVVVKKRGGRKYDELHLKFDRDDRFNIMYTQQKSRFILCWNSIKGCGRAEIAKRMVSS